MILHLFKFGSVATLMLLSLAFNATPAAAGGCGYGCGVVEVAPPPPVVYQQSCSCCGCGGSAYYYAPANTSPSAYYGYAGYGYADSGYPAYGYGYAGAAYRASVAPSRYVNRFYRPRVYVGPRRAWVR
jgi:hypothetical protein